MLENLYIHTIGYLNWTYISLLVIRFVDFPIFLPQFLPSTFFLICARIEILLNPNIHTTMCTNIRVISHIARHAKCYVPLI